MSRRIKVGKVTRVVTSDGRVFIGSLTGYAEVSKGEDVFEELYLSGCGEKLITIQVEKVIDIDQEDCSFPFEPST